MRQNEEGSRKSTSFSGNLENTSRLDRVAFATNTSSIPNILFHTPVFLYNALEELNPLGQDAAHALEPS